MTKAVIASRKPFLVELQAGRAYSWCACGRSARQPFCDGSHAGTGIEPVRFKSDADGEAVLCGCKRTGRVPFCDGAHNALVEKYEEAGADEIQASASIQVTPRSGGSTGKSLLDGGCYVCTIDPESMPRRGNVRLGPVINAGDGARSLSQWFMLVEPGESDALGFPGSEVVLFLPAGPHPCGCCSPFVPSARNPCGRTPCRIISIPLSRRAHSVSTLQNASRWRIAFTRC